LYEPGQEENRASNTLSFAKGGKKRGGGGGGKFIEDVVVKKKIRDGDGPISLIQSRQTGRGEQERGEETTALRIRSPEGEREKKPPPGREISRKPKKRGGEEGRESFS